MNLDDFTHFKNLDAQDMITEIDHLPEQLARAWELGQSLPLPEKKSIRQVIISGMGGSAIGADLLAAYIAPTCPVPVLIQRDYDLPAWAQGAETLVIASSHSGNTEETLETFEAALHNRCSLMAISTGGKLADRATQEKVLLWVFNHHGQPRAAVGYSFGLLMAIFARLNMIPDPAEELAGALKAMKKQQEKIKIEILVSENPAKRLAGQLIGRWVNIYGAGCLAPVARRWKTQINEIAKAGAGFEFLPEADHNALTGLFNPSEMLARTMTVFLNASSCHSRNRLRIEKTQHEFMVEGLNTEVHQAQGETALAHIWTTLHFGDYLAYYLAMAYDSNPTPVDVLENFKAAMKAAT
jgi:glucose/mannose-6-phosphate isomerase